MLKLTSAQIEWRVECESAWLLMSSLQQTHFDYPVVLPVFGRLRASVARCVLLGARSRFEVAALRRVASFGTCKVI